MNHKIQKNKLFFWKGLSKEGKLITGTLYAPNIFAAKLSLFEQKILIKKMGRKYQLPKLKKSGSLTEKDCFNFLQQLSTLFSAGIPLIQTMLVLQRNNHNLAFQVAAETIIQELQCGQPLSSALSKIKSPFDSFSCQLVFLGEQTGTLELVLKRLVSHKEKTLQLKSRIRQALFYPSLVLTSASLITLGLLIGVVPQFESFFANTAHLLPLPTRIVFFISHALKQWGLIAVIIFGIGLIILQLAKKRFAGFMVLFDKWIRQFPIINQLLRNHFIIQFTQNLALAYKTGIPLLQGLDMLQQMETNFSNTIQQIKIAVKNGQPLSEALEKTLLFSSFVIQMVAIGEEAGKLDDMLDKISEVYRLEMTQQIDHYCELIEPLFILFLGLLIGSLVVALYLPIFKLGTVI